MKMKRNRIVFEHGSHGSIMCELELSGSSYRKPTSVRTFVPKYFDCGVRFELRHLDTMCRGNDVDVNSLDVVNTAPLVWYEIDLGYFGGDGNVIRSRHLSRNFLWEWINHDYPTIYQCWTECGAQNDTHPVRDEMMLDVRANPVQIGDFATQTDLNRIRTFCGEGGRVSRAIGIWLEKRTMKPEEGDAAMRRVEDFEHSVNEVIERHRDEIESEIKRFEPDEFCLDCGWMEFYPMDEKLEHDYALVCAMGRRYSDKMRIDFPYITQSTTAQRYGAKLLCEYCEKELNIGLYCYAHLD